MNNAKTLEAILDPNFGVETEWDHFNLTEIKVENLKDQVETYEPAQGDRLIEVYLWDEGKAEGGTSTFAVRGDKVTLAGCSNSGPWGIPPGPEEIVFKKAELSLETFIAEIIKERDDWAKTWDVTWEFVKP
jgi:hypothetical protein